MKNRSKSGNPRFLICLIVTFSILMCWTFYESTALADTNKYGLATSKEGSTGYAIGVGIAATIKKYSENIDMEAIPTPGSTAGVKILGKKGADLAYAGTWTLKDAYDQTGPFEEVPAERLPLQGWYSHTGDWVIITKANRDDINCLNDLAGKKVFPFVSGSGIFDVYRYIFEQLGILDKIKLRQVDPQQAADALKMGTIDAVGAYSNLYGKSTAPWIRDIDSRMDIKVIVPTAEEQELIESLGFFTCGDISNSWLSQKNQKRNQNLWAWSVNYGFHPAPDIPTDDFYEIYKIWIERAESDLAKIHGTLKAHAELGPIEIQLNGLDENPEIPVHPGVAKYLKEEGLWDDKWKVGELDPGVQ